MGYTLGKIGLAKIRIERCDFHFEELEMLWDDRYQQRYGFWRPYVMGVIIRYLDCRDLHCGFARVKCYDCNY